MRKNRPNAKTLSATGSVMDAYFRSYEDVSPPDFPAISPTRESLWHAAAGLTAGLGAWYLSWRWTASLNPDAIVFSVVVAAAETLAYLGTILFFFDIWREEDTPMKPPPVSRSQAGLDDVGPILVDVFLTTYDESLALVSTSIDDAKAVRLPRNTSAQVYVLDDGSRPEVAGLAREKGVKYLSRSSNMGFKAGNLRNGLFHSSGDFVAILDADTRLLPSFLENTLGYFRDPDVAWVQTPHWFYDVPKGGDKRSSGSVRAAFRAWRDPFMADPRVFFDVIQRRRNRHNASFCCGAGSIHRREAVFTDSLRQLGNETARFRKKLAFETDLSVTTALKAMPLQPYKFHVSEDIFTSILMQSDPDRNWKSVYHPRVETRMLSPWSVEAWTAQKLKYAGGTFDIMLNANPIFRSGMPATKKLHYAATFWSYLSIIWLSILFLAPVISLLTGVAPVESYSLEFFIHLLPMLLMSEVAMMIGCKGYDTTRGRMMLIGCLPLQWKALWLVLSGKKPRFPPTPKVPGFSAASRRLIPSFVMLGVVVAAMMFGVISTWLGLNGTSFSNLSVNLFWSGWNGLAVWMVVRLIWWSPQSELAAVESGKTTGGQHDPE